MVDNNEKEKIKTQFLLRYQNLCDKIDEDYKQIIKKTSSPLEEILKDCEKLISYIDKERYDLMIIHGQKKLEKLIGWREIIRGIGLHCGKVVNLAYQTNKITSKDICYQCKEKLSSRLQIFFPVEEKLREWAVDKVIEKNWDAPGFFFCSEDCYKQSSCYSKQNNGQTLERERERERAAPNNFLILNNKLNKALNLIKTKTLIKNFLFAPPVPKKFL